MVLENAPGYEIDNIVFAEAPGILSEISGTVTPSVDSLLMERSISEVGNLHDNISIALGRIGSEVNNAEHQKDINLDKLSKMALDDPSTSSNPRKLDINDMRVMYEHSITGELNDCCSCGRVVSSSKASNLASLSHLKASGSIKHLSSV